MRKYWDWRMQSTIVPLTGQQKGMVGREPDNRDSPIIQGLRDSHECIQGTLQCVLLMAGETVSWRIRPFLALIPFKIELRANKGVHSCLPVHGNKNSYSMRQWISGTLLLKFTLNILLKIGKFYRESFFKKILECFTTI